MTLTVLMEEGDDVAAVGETLGRLMRDHPSRAIVVLVPPSGDRILDAHVLAQCWMPFGKREQICCEQVRITVSEASFPDLPSVLLPLTAPDLPVFLWCRSPRLFRLPGFPAIEQAVGKLIVDSNAFDEPAAILAELAAMRASERVADLAWTRLTRWRELIAQAFENRNHHGCLQSISRVRVSYAGARAPTDAYYLAAWLLMGLEKGGGHARVELECAGAHGPEPLCGVGLTAGESTEERFSVARAQDGAVDVKIDGLSCRTMFEAPSDYVMLREELSIYGRDPVFDEVLPRAAAIAV